MSNHLLPPDAFRWTNPTPTSVAFSWRGAEGASVYELRGGGTEIIRSVDGTSTLIKGLPVSSDHIIQIRSVADDGERSAWEDVMVFTSVGVPIQSPPTTYIRLLDADRQSFRIRLPSVDGDLLDCLIKIWWQPSDRGWWASLEAPIGTKIIESRRLGLNCGLLDGLGGVLGGNIVIRQITIGGSVEPDRQSFVAGTHRLAWEAFS